MVDPERYMAQALSLAEQGVGRTCPNPPVGAVLLQGDRVVGQGFHPRAGEPHAEIFALRDAGALAKGGTIYVTLEPCSHTGRTGPCADALIEAGISEVVVGCLDPNPAVAGRGVERLRRAGVQVRTGILEADCRELIVPFSKHIRTGRPWTLFKAAMTLDGQMATAGGDSRWVSGPASRAEVHRLRDRLDAIMVGVGTVLADDPQLTTRLPEGTGRNPLRVVVDSDLLIPLECRLLQPELATGTLVVCCDDTSEAKRNAVAATGAQLLALPRVGEHVSLPELWDTLGQWPVMSILLEGGATLAHAVLQAGLMDRLRLYVAPKLVGGEGAVPLFRGATVDRMSQALPVRDMQIRRCGDDIVIEGDVAGCLPG